MKYFVRMNIDVFFFFGIRREIDFAAAWKMLARVSEDYQGELRWAERRKTLGSRAEIGQLLSGRLGSRYLRLRHELRRK